MPQRTVMINVTLEFRNKIKALKKELTYEQFLDNLIGKKSGNSPIAKNHPRMTKGDSS